MIDDFIEEQTPDQKRLHDLCKDKWILKNKEGMREIGDLSLKLGKDIGEDKYGNTPLHASCYWGHQAVVEILIRNGGDVNAVNTTIYGITPPLLTILTLLPTPI